MFYILENEKIAVIDADLNKLKDTLLFLPQFTEADILETEKEIVNIEGQYYFADDEKVTEYQKEKRKAEILEQLNEIDLKSIRALRAEESERLVELEKEAEELREELRNL